MISNSNLTNKTEPLSFVCITKVYHNRVGLLEQFKTDIYISVNKWFCMRTLGEDLINILF